MCSYRTRYAFLEHFSHSGRKIVNMLLRSSTNFSPGFKHNISNYNEIVNHSHILGLTLKHSPASICANIPMFLILDASLMLLQQ